MKGHEAGVTVIEKSHIQAKVSSVVIEQDGHKRLAFKASLPEGYIYPEIQQAHPEESVGAGLVADRFVDDVEAWKQIDTSPACKGAVL